MSGQWKSYLPLALFLPFLIAASAFAELEEMSLAEFERRVYAGEFAHLKDQKYEIIRLAFDSPPARFPERLENVLLALRSQTQGVVEGAFIDEGFDEEARRLEVTADRSVGAAYIVRLSSDDALVSRRAAFRRAGRLLGKLFGVPNGINGPGEVRFLRPKPKYLSLLWITEGLQNAILGLEGLPNLVLSAYLYAYLGNLDGILRMKDSGGALRIDPSATGKRNVWIEPNYRWVTTQTTLEDLIIYTAMRSSMGRRGGRREPLYKVIGDPALSAWAKTLTEQIITTIWNLAHEARIRGDYAAKEKYEKWVLIMQHASYNVVFPLLRKGQMPNAGPLQRLITYASLVSMGMIAVGRELRWNHRLRSLPRMSEDCAFLISFEKGEPISDPTSDANPDDESAGAGACADGACRGNVVGSLES